MLEGHADEEELENITWHLVKKSLQLNYLMTYGISSDRITVLSYGKERPVDSGSNH